MPTLPSHHTVEVAHRDGTVERYERRDDGTGIVIFYHMVISGGGTGGMKVQTTSSHSVYNHVTPGWDSEDEDSGDEDSDEDSDEDIHGRSHKMYNKR
jgi:hypothetical protein